MYLPSYLHQTRQNMQLLCSFVIFHFFDASSVWFCSSSVAPYISLALASGASTWFDPWSHKLKGQNNEIYSKLL